MMALIKDQESKAVGPTIEMNVGGIVSRYREVLKIIIAAAKQPHRRLEGQEKFIVPLIQKVDGGRYHERRPAGAKVRIGKP